MDSGSVNTLESLFEYYSGGKDFVKTNLVKEIVCELGYAPSLKEMSDFTKKFGNHCDLNALRGFLTTIEHPEDTHANLTELFKYYDPGNTGRVSRRVLEKVLANVGEGLSEQELATFFEVLCNDENEVDYEELVEK